MTVLDQYSELKKSASRRSAGKLMNNYVAYVRAAQTIHQLGHWTCKSAQFYGNHLLLERIYDAAQARLDAVAEKTIGLFGNDAIDANEQMATLKKLVAKYSSEDPLANSLAIEEAFLAVAKETYENLSGTKDMTLGLDDLIMAQCSDAETSVYLLKQAIG